jgi:hypothetical protein
MTSINLVPTIRNILGGGSNSGDEVNDICNLDNFIEHYAGNTTILYYKPGIFRCGYNKQKYKDKLKTSEKSPGISDRYTKDPISGTSKSIFNFTSDSLGFSSTGSSSSPYGSSGFYSYTGSSGSSGPLAIIPAPLKEPSEEIRENAKLKSRGIINEDKNTCFANSLFQMLSYIPEWYVLLESSIYDYMKQLKQLFGLIKDQTDSSPIQFNMTECLKKTLGQDIGDGKIIESSGDPIILLMKILEHHEQFKIFNLKEETEIICRYNKIGDNKNLVHTLNMLWLLTYPRRSITYLVEKKSNETINETTPTELAVSCEKQSGSKNGPGPYIKKHTYDFSETVYLIICLQRSTDFFSEYKKELATRFKEKYKKEYADEYTQEYAIKYATELKTEFEQKYKQDTKYDDIILDYELTIQGIKFILEGFISRQIGTDGEYYVYVKILDEKHHIVHRDKTVYDIPDDYSINDSYRTRAILLLYKKLLK